MFKTFDLETRIYRVISVGRVRLGWYQSRPSSFTIWAVRRA